MIVDFRKCDTEHFSNYDICIIGAGAAGITVARSLYQDGLRIALLESGGTDYESDVQQLAQGSSSGYPYYELVDSRLRFFGGTTSIWGGRCALFDEIDFVKRDWLPYSGWPFQRSELMPYYHRAQSLLGLDPLQLDSNTWSKHDLEPPPFDQALIDTSFWQFDGVADRFVMSRAEDLQQAENVCIFLHATVTDIALNEAGDQVNYVEIADTLGKRGKVKAGTFVLAAGGLENPRLLLNSRGVQSRGIGNQNDLVGRFFMEHAHARGGRLVTNEPWRTIKILPRAYRHRGDRYASVARPGLTLQGEEQILNTSFTISARRRSDQKQALSTRAYQSLRHELNPTSGNRRLWQFQRRVFARAAQHVGQYLRWMVVKSGMQDLYAVIRAEQAPNPDSRVTLVDEKDALGMQKINLDWRFMEIDKRTVSVLMRTLDKEMKRLDLGHLELAPWLEDDSIPWETDELISNHAIAGYHHMGTTRMSSDPRTGVVDEHCRIHGVRNIYVAGSSVFPTSSWANPTLTILALCLKLADHLKKNY